MTEDQNKFHKDGYIILKKVLNDKTINKLRVDLNSEFIKQNNPKLIDSYQLVNNKIIFDDIFINSSMFEKIQDIFKNQDFYEINILPPFQIMRNFFPRLKAHTWHIDASGEFRYKFCREKLKNKKYLYAKVGIYLQRNTNFGGQIDIIPKSHKLYSKGDPINFIKKNFLKIKMNLVKKMSTNLKNKFEQRLLKYTRLDLDPGDVVIFDSRTYHRATPIDLKVENQVAFDKNSNYVKDLKFENSKYAIYFQFGNKIGLDSYWYDRSKRKDNDVEINQWKQTELEIKNYFKTIKIPKLINFSLNNIFKN
tara:strand:+ start:173 stop:1093 length:921 start_codon:yes stop_codon:yes gene_type:complete